ncbi:MAG: TerC/Alx family metal homeostasis membrane protein [Eubacteriales bacterium]|nr:TerC/Alx family metal homeostasis membrane protein [Eubacteriales bacterium]
MTAWCFCLGIYFKQGMEKAIEFASAYLIEFSLSVDNLFVFLLIFISFGINEHAQHKVLNYGIAGTIILRFVFIFLGLSLINKFEWLLWVFGAVLIFSGVKMLKKGYGEEDPRDGVVYKAISKFLPLSADFCGEKFVLKNDGSNYDKNSLISKKAKWLATPLTVVMILIILMDIVFAIDSVPAVISMTRDMFIVYTSNLFAVMGLRQMFFLLEHMHQKFRYVKYGVGIILMFTGVKMLLDIIHIRVPNLVSIGVILFLIISSIIISVIVTKRQEKREKDLRDAADYLERKVEIEQALKEMDTEEK